MTRPLPVEHGSAEPSDASLAPFRRLCLITCVAIFGLIVLGGVVRATDSGLGCPDWPRCHGSFVPRWEKHTLIEYSHRLTASVVGLLALAVVVWAWRSYRRIPAIVYPATLAFVLLLVQAWLGKETVERELPPEIVAVHLTMALTILSLLSLVLTTTFALEPGITRPPVSRAFGRVAIVASATTLVLMLLGSYVSGAGYGLACSGWPLCNQQLIPTSDLTSVQVHFLHRFTALVLGLVLVGLVWLGWHDRRQAPFAAYLAVAACVVYVIQALIGAANIWTRLADEAGAAHLAFATLLWTLLAILNIRVHRLYELLPLSSREKAPAALAEAPR
jgi:heme A synthase